MERYVTTEKTRRELLSLLGSAALLTIGTMGLTLFDAIEKREAMASIRTEPNQRKLSEIKRNVKRIPDAEIETRKGEVLIGTIPVDAEIYSEVAAHLKSSYKNVFVRKGAILSEVMRYSDYIWKYTSGDKINLGKALTGAESAGNPKAEHPRSKARGLTQLMEETARDMNLIVLADRFQNYIVDERFHPERSVYGGMRYLQEQIEKNNGNAVQALIAYNWGPAKRDELEKRNLAGKPWRELKRYLPPETRNYILDVFTNLELLESPEKYEKDGFKITKKELYSQELRNKARGHYPAARGENLRNIARKFGVNLESAMEVNPQVLSARSAIPTGYKIIIPKAA